MLAPAIFLFAVAAVQFPDHRAVPSCHRYDGVFFRGEIQSLRLRKSTPNSWSGEDVSCERLFFPVKLGKTVDPKAAKRITSALNSIGVSDRYVEIDAFVRIRMYADHSGGDVTIVGVKGGPR